MDNPSALDHLQDKADSPHVSGNEAETVSLTPVESFSLISISHSLYENRLPADFFNPIVRDMLLFYAEQGDVQMAASILIVLGDRIRKEIDDQAQVPAPVLASGRGDKQSLRDGDSADRTMSSSVLLLWVWRPRSAPPLCPLFSSKGENEKGRGSQDNGRVPGQEH